MSESPGALLPTASVVAIGGVMEAGAASPLTQHGAGDIALPESRRRL